MPSDTTLQFAAYRITNLISGKVYIGITTAGLKRRWAEHLLLSKSRKRNALHLAIAKYGAENFVMQAIASAGSRDALCLLEIELIRTHNSIAPHGYNMTSGGDGMLSPADDVRAKMKAKATARNATDEARSAYKQRVLAMWNKPGARESIGAAMSAGHAAPEVYAAKSDRMKAQWAASPEKREALAKRNLERMASPEARAAYGEKMRAHFAVHPELGKAQSERMRARLSRPEVRAANSARAKAQVEAKTPEAKAKWAAAMRAGKLRAQAARIAKETDA